MFLITITLANNKTKSWGDGESLKLKVDLRRPIAEALLNSSIDRSLGRRCRPPGRLCLLRATLRSSPSDSLPTLGQPDRHHLLHHRLVAPHRRKDRWRILLYILARRCRADQQVGYPTEQHRKLLRYHLGRRRWFRRTIHKEDQIRRHLWVHLSDPRDRLDDQVQDQYQQQGRARRRPGRQRIRCRVYQFPYPGGVTVGFQARA